MSGGDFWSKRRAAVAEAEAADLKEAALAVEIAEQEAVALEDDALSDDELLEKYELPDPDTLEEGDDFSAFMSDAIPARLRNRALRKLWLTNPTLANVDGLVDYGEDFTDAATVIENMQTVYQVGKGMVSKWLEVDEGEDDLEAADADEDLVAEAVPEADPNAIEPENPTESLNQNDMEIAAIQSEPIPRLEAEIHPETSVKPRMRFHFPPNG